MSIAKDTIVAGAARCCRSAQSVSIGEESDVGEVSVALVLCARPSLCPGTEISGNGGGPRLRDHSGSKVVPRETMGRW